MGLGRMESEFSLRNRSCDFWSICQRLALFSATHQAAPIISMCAPGMHSSRESTEQLQECAYSEIQSGHTHCWVFVFLSYATDTLFKL